VLHRTRNRWLRPGLIVLALQAVIVGVWALAAPQSFYSEFPIVGGSWVNEFPPYNEHLVRDVGGLYTGFALLFLWAAVSLEATLVKAALVSWLPFAGLHLYFHVTNMAGLEAVEKLLQTGVLGLAFVIPLALLYAAGKRRNATFAALR
jgi:hypothetical protein